MSLMIVHSAQVSMQIVTATGQCFILQLQYSIDRQTKFVKRISLRSVKMMTTFGFYFGNCTGNNNRWRSSVKLYGPICSRSSISVLIFKATTEPWFRNFALVTTVMIACLDIHHRPVNSCYRRTERRMTKTFPPVCLQ